MTTQQRRNPVVTATSAGVQTADAADAAAHPPLVRPDLLVKGNVEPKGERAVQAPVSLTMTITLESGLTMVAAETPIAAGDLAGPTTHRAHRCEADLPTRRAGFVGFGRQRAQLVGVRWCRRRRGRAPTTSWTTRPRRPSDPEPEREIYATRVAEVLTGPDGSFEYSWDPTDRVRGKLTSRVVCRVEMQAHVPGAHLRTVEVERVGRQQRRHHRGPERGAVGHHVQDRLRRAATRPGAAVPRPGRAHGGLLRRRRVRRGAALPAGQPHPDAPPGTAPAAGAGPVGDAVAPLDRHVLQRVRVRRRPGPTSASTTTRSEERSTPGPPSAPHRSRPRTSRPTRPGTSRSWSSRSARGPSRARWTSASSTSRS